MIVILAFPLSLSFSVDLAPLLIGHMMKVDGLLIFPLQLLIQVTYAISLFRFECEATLWKYAIVITFDVEICRSCVFSIALDIISYLMFLFNVFKTD